MGIRVFLVDDSADTLRQIEATLALGPDRYQVVGRATSGHAFLRALAQVEVDVVCLDLSMPRLNGVEVLHRLREQRPSLPVLVLTAFADASWVLPALEAGANGYVLKTAPAAEFLGAVEAVLAGTFPTDASVLAGLADSLPSGAFARQIHLSPGERDILDDLVDGLTNVEIAHRRHLSLSGVKQVLTALSGKLGARNRTHIVTQAARHGLVMFSAVDGQR